MTLRLRQTGTRSRYVYFSSDKMTKNHRGEIFDNAKSQSGRMYETKSNDCPVRLFCKYVERLHPNCDSFWQRPKSAVPKDCQVWYDCQSVGKNKLGNKMREISEKAKTSIIYTNHCLRATAITTLDEHGFEARHIMAVSGHKSENSIRPYSRVQERHKRNMSFCLSEKYAAPDNCSNTPNSPRVRRIHRRRKRGGRGGDRPSNPKRGGAKRIFAPPKRPLL